MKIDDCGFGRIVIGGKEYRNDVIVFHNRVRSDWWRVEGHSLHRDDLEEILAAAPSTLILGRGAVGMMRVPASIESLLQERGITLVSLRTGAAVKEYNSHADDPGVVGAFHLTC
jgi:hypothetical protein